MRACRLWVVGLSLFGVAGCADLAHGREDDGGTENDAAVVVDLGEAVDAAEAVDVGVPVEDAGSSSCTDPTGCGAPRPLAPHSTGVVTSRQPTFRFQPATGASAHVVTICADPTCTTVIESIPTTSTRVVPSAPLPVGPVFWRVTAEGGASSVTWELFVGPRSAPGDTSWLGPPDFDRDGHVDVALGSGSNAVYVMRGAVGGLPASDPSQTIPGLSGFGRATANAGDVDGDGYGDLAVGALDPMASFGAVLRGGPSGLATTPTILPVPSAGGMFVAAVAVGGAGDVNGDGYADVLVSTTLTSLFLGGPTGPSATPSGGLLAGGSGAGAGDVDGDGFADVIVCSGGAGATVYFGSTAGLGRPQTIPAPAGTIGFGEVCTGAGDVNGDGFADVLVATQGTESAFVVLGSAAGPVAGSAVQLDPGNGGSGVQVLTSIATAGDVDGDGFADVLVGTYNTSRLYVHRGSAGGIVAAPVATIDLPGGEYGNSVAALGDSNGDGFGDVAVAPSQCNGFPVLVYGGHASGVTTSPALRTWDAPPGAQCYGIIAR